jgi:hypothetical protein
MTPRQGKTKPGLTRMQSRKPGFTVVELVGTLVFVSIAFGGLVNLTLSVREYRRTSYWRTADAAERLHRQAEVQTGIVPGLVGMDLLGGAGKLTAYPQTPVTILPVSLPRSGHYLRTDLVAVDLGQTSGRENPIQGAAGCFLLAQLRDEAHNAVHPMYPPSFNTAVYGASGSFNGRFPVREDFWIFDSRNPVGTSHHYTASVYNESPPNPTKDSPLLPCAPFTAQTVPYRVKAIAYCNLCGKSSSVVEYEFRLPDNGSGIAALFDTPISFLKFAAQDYSFKWNYGTLWTGYWELLSTVGGTAVTKKIATANTLDEPLATAYYNYIIGNDTDTGKTRGTFYPNNGYWAESSQKTVVKEVKITQEDSDTVAADEGD